MKRHRALPPLAAGAACAVLLIGCGGGDDDNDVSRAEFEQDGLLWPLAAESASIRCDGNAVIATVDGVDYALNDTALGQGLPNIAQVQATDTAMAELIENEGMSDAIVPRAPVDDLVNTATAACD